jgi:hypothetical protein
MVLAGADWRRSVNKKSVRRYILDRKLVRRRRRGVLAGVP